MRNCVTVAEEGGKKSCMTSVRVQATDVKGKASEATVPGTHPKKKVMQVCTVKDDVIFSY